MMTNNWDFYKSSALDGEYDGLDSMLLVSA